MKYPSAKVRLGTEAAAALRALADHYGDTGQTDQAIATYETLLAKVRASNPKSETDLRDANSLSRINRDLGNFRRRAGAHLTPRTPIGVRFSNGPYPGWLAVARSPRANIPARLRRAMQPGGLRGH